MFRSSRGFTLVETLVGLLILTFIVTTSLIIVFERERRLQHAAETIAAYQALSNEVEIQRHIPYEELKIGESNQFQGDLAILQDLPDVVRHISTEETQPGVKSVTLEIRWRAGARSASLSMVRTNTGGSNLW